MKDKVLVTLLAGHEIGRVTESNGRLRFVYDDDWRSAPDAFPLSLSMPLTVAEHDDEVVSAFLWGLLPDNQQILDTWARRFQVSPRNCFSLLSNVGEDCAGAVQFVAPERAAALTSQSSVDWFDEAEVELRLRALRTDAGAWRKADDSGQFSLAGAQPKIALYREGERWGVPSGRMPTTHILKPPIAELEGHVENEHYCLSLARELGLPAVRSEVKHFGDQVAIVVERYDRIARSPRSAKVPQAGTPTSVLRIHQEDLCQALGISPTLKYQNEGGPAPRDVVSLLRQHSSRAADDTRTFAQALAFNWLIAGTDAHAKNYSLLHGPRQRVRLAPLYDIASVLPYPEYSERRAKLAMKIGNSYRLQEIARADWEKLGQELGLDAGSLVAENIELARRIGACALEVQRSLTAAGLEHPLLDRLTIAIAARASGCLRSLGASG